MAKLICNHKSRINRHLRIGTWIQIGSIYEPGQKLTLIKKWTKSFKIHQNPAILNVFHDFVRLW